MADALLVIPTAVLRNLSDKLYEKRKNATREVSSFPFPAEISDFDVLAMAGDHNKITTMSNPLTNEFTSSPQANHRKGGLIGLAAATVETISKP
ncbi:hypothetical protein Syun_011788 [Stephania yunnanensis]|uniref:Uncharacterized protein n=1 Tax=Stephania yunnanensis TaxID=152371 RepID=A0AAP0PEN6_9MAGN